MEKEINVEKIKQRIKDLRNSAKMVLQTRG